MKNKRIIIGVVLACFLMLMIPNVSAINKQTVENEIQEKNNFNIESKIIHLIQKTKNIENIDLDIILLIDIIYYFLALFLVIGLPITFIFAPLFAIGFSLWGMILGITHKTGDILQKIVVGFIFGLLSSIFRWFEVFDVVTFGKIRGIDKIEEFEDNLQDMFFEGIDCFEMFDNIINIFETINSLIDWIFSEIFQIYPNKTY